VQEKFNYHHSSLRNVVEREFGVLKSRWHILQGVPYYAREKHTKILIAYFALHNFCWSIDLQELNMGTWFEMRTTKCPHGWQQMLLRI
jgi:hypothetical protein